MREYVCAVCARMCVCVFRYVGLPRSGPGAEEVAVRHDEERSGARGPEEALEVAADAAEQRGDH